MRPLNSSKGYWLSTAITARTILTARRALEHWYPNRQLNHAYNELYQASMVARYLPLSRCPNVKVVRETLIGRRLQHISQYVASHA